MRPVFNPALAVGVAVIALALAAATASSAPGAAGATQLAAGSVSAGPHDGDCYFTHRPVFDAGGTFRGMQPAEVCS